jgi:3-deoxy-D-manno-octulosonate 8-phosphate phosphatase (KDO 8-P phosphatase)
MVDATNRLPIEELAARAHRVRLVLTDCDGVLTDTGVYYSDAGGTYRRFSVRDGMGVELLRNAGVATSIISGENSPAILHRATKLSLPFCYLGIKDKAQHLSIICEESGLTESEMAFIGDDVNDLGLLERVGSLGLTGAPRDAMPAVLAAVHHQGDMPGGHGAFRDFAEWILRLRSRPF